MHFNRRSRGMALIASMVIILIVSIVAVAIASTSLSNRVASFSTYDTTSSYANAQAGINLGEVILMTAKTTEMDDTPAFKNNDKAPSGKVARKVANDCLNYANLATRLHKAGECFWWVGSTNSYIKNDNFMNVIGSTYYDADVYPHAETRFKLEERPEIRTRSLESGDKLGKKFYRITSIGHGNTDGISKIQGQIGVYSVIEVNPVVDANAADY